VSPSASFDKIAPTHYVLVIHGTWNRPKRGVRKWYQLDKENPDNFCTRLNDLVRPVFGDAVWRPCTRIPLRVLPPLHFSWRGQNTDEGRVTAARRLYRLLMQIGRHDPSAVIHLVAHSHGGNVVLHALQLYFEELTRQVAPEPGRWWDAEHQEDFQRRNRIGRIVFLGTPFLRKTWTKPPRVLTALSKAVTTAFVIPIIALFLTFLLVAILLIGLPSALLRAIFPRAFKTKESDKPDPRPAFLKPLKTFLLSPFVVLGLLMLLPIALNVLALAAIVSPASFGSLVWSALAWFWLIGLTICSIAIRYSVNSESLLETETHPITNNIYWQSHAFVSSTEPLLRALVVHAGLIDEAQLAMSSNSIALAYLSPILDSLTSLRPRPRMAERISGSTGDMLADAIFSVERSVTRSVADALMTLATPLTWVASRVARRYGRALLERLLKSAATGVGPHEFDRAQITTGLRTGEHLIHESEWDVTRALISTPPKSVIKAVSSGGFGGELPFSFLWDSAKLAAEKEGSDLWERVQRALPEAGNGLGELEEPGKESEKERLLRASLILQERVKGILGAIELTHSTYYTNDEVILGIAGFLMYGETPATSGFYSSGWDDPGCPSTG
jgi:hypothetical protein